MTALTHAAAVAGMPSLGVWGNVGRGFAHPVDVTHDPATGQVLVLNASTSWDSPHGRAVRVTVLSSADDDAGVVREIATYGTGEGQLTSPVGIAVCGERIAVTDEHTHDISLFATDGTVLGRLGGPGEDPGRFHHPAGILATEDCLWVVDAGNDRIQRLGWDGEPLATVGCRGLGPGQLRHPWALALGGDGELWVSDWGNDRVQALDVDGRCLAVIGSSGGAPFHRPAGIAIGPEGNRYVADWGRRRLQVFDASWTRLDIWYGAAVPSGWVQERMTEFPQMAQLRRDSRDPGGEALLGRPTGLCALPDGRVLLADTGHHRLQTYLPDPHLTRSPRS